MFSVRGATTIEHDNKQEILEACEELLEKMITKNGIINDNIISIIFTCTRDIKSAYPAEAARLMGITKAGLMCLQEMFVEGSLEKCIRILLLSEGNKKQSEIKHIYLKKASALRPDLMQEF